MTHNDFAETMFCEPTRTEKIGMRRFLEENAEPTDGWSVGEWLIVIFAAGVCIALALGKLA
jgi:hypothetical protein